MVVCLQENHKYTQKQRKDAVIKAQQVIIRIFSLLGLFGILYKWSHVKGSTVKYVKPPALPLGISDDLVTKLEGSLSILYHLVGNAESGTMHMVRRDDASSNHEFHLTMHRIWFCLQHIYLGFVLYKIIYKYVLLFKEAYKNGPRKRKDKKAAMQFLLDTSVECPERPSYIFLLAHTCLVFKNVEDVSALQDDFLVKQCLAKPHEDLMLKVDKLLSDDFKSKKQKSTSISSSRSSIPLPRDTAVTATMQPLVTLPDIHHEEPSLSNLSPNVLPLAIERVSLDVIVSSLAVISSSLPDLSFHQLTTGSNLQCWDSLKLAPLQNLQDQEHIYAMAFSNPDFYSASGLVNHEHWRSISCEGADVRHELFGLNLIRIPLTVLQQLNPLNILDVVRPGSPIYQRCQVHYKGNLLKLFCFVVFHGKSPMGPDLRLTRDNRSVKMELILELDSAVVKATVAQLIDFLWYVAQDVQITAER
eukprot:jgi/Psemu1/43224/gm1.43224_g